MAVLVRVIFPVAADDVTFRVGVSETPKTWAWTDSYTIGRTPPSTPAPAPVPEKEADPRVETP
jgi:hypothetical protein